MSSPFSSIDRVQQFVVQFACRIPVRKELDPGEKKTLRSLLQEFDKDSFQLFDESSKRPGCLFEVLRQVPIKANLITGPSFVFSTDSFSFITPIRMLRNYINGFSSLDTSILNRTRLDWIVKLHNAVNNLNCQRAGKIYELLLGPFNKDEKRSILSNLFSISLSEIGELNFTFTKYIAISEKEIYNILTRVNYLQADLNSDFFINMRVDINNRDLVNRMDPRDIERVWKFADDQIFDHLKNTVTI